MKNLISAAVLVTGILVSSGAWTGEKLTVGSVLFIHDNGADEEKSTMTDLIGFMGQGMEEANIRLKELKRRPIFCPPEKLHITTQQYFSIFRNFVEEHKLEDKSEKAIRPILLFSLEATFPCPK